MRRNNAREQGSAPKASTGDPRWKSACTPEQLAKRGSRKPVNLALQGGGAHGAFTWGVLERPLEDDRLAIDAVSATNAGSMNAVVMVIGMSEDGRDGARGKLAAFWRETSCIGQLWSPVQGSPWDHANGGSLPWPTRAAAAYLMFDAMTRAWSPYQLKLLDINPLKEVLSRTVDFERLRSCPHATRLFLSATNVLTGKIRVFENNEITPDVVMASACLPCIFKAVVVEGEPYWDGGFLGNPAIFPLIYRGASADVIIVHINPIVRDTLPTTAPEIFDRMNEISFNSFLMREMRAFAFVTRLLEDEAIDDRRYKRMLIHSVRDEAEMSRHGAESKMNLDWSFLEHL